MGVREAFLLLLPLAVFLILRLEYKLIFGPNRILKTHALEHLGWLRHPDKDCMMKDGIEADMSLTFYENVLLHRRAMSKIPPKIDIDSESVDGIDKGEATE